MYINISGKTYNEVYDELMNNLDRIPTEIEFSNVMNVSRQMINSLKSRRGFKFLNKSKANLYDDKKLYDHLCDILQRNPTKSEFMTALKMNSNVQKGYIRIKNLIKEYSDISFNEDIITRIEFIRICYNILENKIGDKPSKVHLANFIGDYVNIVYRYMPYLNLDFNDGRKLDVFNVPKNEHDDTYIRLFYNLGRIPTFKEFKNELSKNNIKLDEGYISNNGFKFYSEDITQYGI